MGTRTFGSGNDNFKAYKEGGILGIGDEWRPWFIDGGAGNDTLVGGALNDTINGGNDNDLLKGMEGADLLNGGAGNDTLYGFDADRYEAAIDTLNGGTGNDTYYADTNDVIIEAADGGFYDVLHLYKDWSSSSGDYFMPANIERLELEGFHNERVFGNGLDNTILVNGVNYSVVDGGGGKDYLRAGSYGGVGSTLRGGADNDTLDGAINNDNLLGDGGDDLLNGVGFGSGTTGVGTIDTLTGGDGADRFVLGNAVQSYYSDGNIHTSGLNDYALITDFQSGVDKLIINGPSYAYIIRQEFSLGIGSSDKLDTLIFRDSGTSTPDLIAILQDTTSLAITDFIST